VIDAICGKLLVVTEMDAAGNTVKRERRRRAGNIAARRKPGKGPGASKRDRIGGLMVRRIGATVRRGRPVTIAT
jgi:hypothetical protein